MCVPYTTRLWSVDHETFSPAIHKKGLPPCFKDTLQLLHCTVRPFKTLFLMLNIFETNPIRISSCSSYGSIKHNKHIKTMMFSSALAPILVYCKALLNGHSNGVLSPQALFWRIYLKRTPSSTLDNSSINWYGLNHVNFACRVFFSFCQGSLNSQISTLFKK